MKKRVLSLLMALVLCLSLLPTAALADEGESGGTESGGTTATCSHGGANGFGINDMTCPGCGAPAVAYTALVLDDPNENPWRNFADLQTALDANRQGSSVVGLLATVTGDYTIDGTTDTGLDLNGCSINGTVTVTGKGGEETAFSNSKSTGTIQKVVASSGANLAVSGAAAVIKKLTLAEGATWENILFLPRNPGYKVYTNYPDLNSYTWYAPTDVPAKSTELTNVTIERLPITSNTLSIYNGSSRVGSSVDRGTAVQLRAYCNTSGADVTFYIQKGSDEMPTALTNARYEKRYYVADYTFDEMTSYTIWFTATKDGYSVTSNEKKLTVTKLKLSKAVITFTGGNVSAYDPSGTTSVPPYTVTYNDQELTEGVDYNVVSGASRSNIGTATLKIKAAEGSEYTGTKSASWKVAAHKVNVVVEGDVVKTYDGTADLPAGTKISFVSVDDNYRGTNPELTLVKGTDYTLIDAKYDSADAGDTEKKISFTAKLLGNKYTFGTSAQKIVQIDGAALEDQIFKINPATIDLSKTEITQYVYNNLEKTYEIDLEPMLEALLAQQTPTGVEYGTIRYGTCSVNPTVDGYYDANNPAAVANGVLTLPIAAANSANVDNQIATVTVDVNTTNYGLFQLPIKVKVGEKITPVPAEGFTASATDITYGQTLADSTLTVTGTMKDPRTGETVNGSFAWTNPDAKPNAGSYEAEWTFTPDESYDGIYAAAAGKATVNVARKDIAGATVKLEADSFEYNKTAQSPTISSVTLDGWSETITYDVVSGGSATDASESITLTIQGNGNYTGTATAVWKITPRKVTPTIEVAEGSYIYNEGSEIKPTVTVTDVLGDTIDPKEYDVSYSNNINAGEATVTVTSKPNGNYDFSGSTTFTINRKQAALDLTGMSPLDKVYDGSNAAAVGVTAAGYDGTLRYAWYKDGVQIGEGASGGPADAGSYKLVITAPETGNCEGASEEKTFTISPREITCTVTADQGKVYGQAEPAYAYSFANTVDGQTPRLSLQREAGENAGQYKFLTAAAALEDNYPFIAGNYTLVFAAGDVYFTIRPKQVTDPTIIVNGDPFTYNDGDPIKPTVTVKDGDVVIDPSEYTVSYSNNTSAGKATVTVTNKDGGNYIVSGSKTFTINKADSSVAAAPAARTLTYSGAEQQLVTAGEALGGTMVYSLDGKTYGSDIPAAVNAGEYTVWYKVEGDSNHNGTEAVSVKVTIGKADASVAAAPAAQTLTYNGNGQQLVTAGEALGGTMVYSLDGKTCGGDIPTAVNAGEYTVWYKVAGDSNHNDTAAASVTVTIGKADAKVAAAPAARTLTYNGNEQQLVTAGEALGGTMVYSLDGKTYGSDIPVAVNAGEYTVWYKVEGDSNHNDTAAVSVTVTIGKADASVKTAPAAQTLTYNGNGQQLVTAGEALGGTMVYSLDGETYGSDIPTAVNAGEYTVYYKVEGDSNHNDTEAASVKVTIARAKLTGEVACRTFPCYGYTLGDTHITAPEGWPEGGFQWYDVNGKALADDTVIIPDATYRWVFRDDLGNYEPVSGSIVLWNYVPETTETGKSETVKNPDGSTTTSVTKPDGTVTETTTMPDGTTSTTTTDKDGNTDTDVRVSDKAVSDAKKDGSTIKLPVDGRPGQEIDIDIRTGGEDVTIEIPVSGATGGTVAIIVKDDGTEEVVRESVVTGDGIRMKVSGSVTVKVADRSKDFIDMRGHWAKNEADTVVARGLFNGTSDTMFSPSLPMTRGMVVTVLARMSGADTSGGTKWYDKGCAWAVANGISDGAAPEASITREQLVTMLYRYAKLRGVDVTASGTALQSFSDYESVSPYAVEAMDWAVTKGLVNGINGRLEPQGTATRAQVAAIFARFLKLL